MLEIGLGLHHPPVVHVKPHSSPAVRLGLSGIGCSTLSDFVRGGMRTSSSSTRGRQPGFCNGCASLTLLTLRLSIGCGCGCICKMDALALLLLCICRAAALRSLEILPNLINSASTLSEIQKFGSLRVLKNGSNRGRTFLHM